MTNVQLYFAIGIPALLNAGMFVMFLAYMNARFSAVDSRFSEVNERFKSLELNMNTQFAGVNQRFNSVDRRFDDMRDLWRSELHRVEEVLDARLKHLEQH